MMFPSRGSAANERALTTARALAGLLVLVLDDRTHEPPTVRAAKRAFAGYSAFVPPSHDARQVPNALRAIAEHSVVRSASRPATGTMMLGAAGWLLGRERVQGWLGWAALVP